jgi:hypothetical protein
METNETNLLSRLQSNVRTWISADAGTDSDWGEAWIDDDDGKVYVGWIVGGASPISPDDASLTIHGTDRAALEAFESAYEESSR